MPRLTISLPDKLYQQISVSAAIKNESLSSVINDLLYMSLEGTAEKESDVRPIEQHCQLLTMQMTAMMKSLVAELLKFEQSDFIKLRHDAEIKYKAYNTDLAKS